MSLVKKVKNLLYTENERVKGDDLGQMSLMREALIEIADHIDMSEINQAQQDHNDDLEEVYGDKSDKETISSNWTPVKKPLPNLDEMDLFDASKYLKDELNYWHDFSQNDTLEYIYNKTDILFWTPVLKPDGWSPNIKEWLVNKIKELHKEGNDE